MIKLFGVTDKSYASNGDIVLETTKAKVHKEDNGDFYINVEAPLTENEKYIPAVEGSTVSGTSFTINNVDTNKSYELTQITGNTDETNVVSGRQEVSIVGKNLFNINNAINGNTSYTFENDILSVQATGGNYNKIRLNATEVETIIKNNAGKTLKFRFDNLDLSQFDSSSNNIIQLTYSINETNSYNRILAKNTSSPTGYTLYDFVIPSDTSGMSNFRLDIYTNNSSTTNNTSKVVITKPMFYFGEDSSYEEYKGQSYEINLGKNLFNPTNTFDSDGVEATINNQEITFNGTSTAGKTYKMADIDMPSGTYTISLEVVSGTHNNNKNVWFDFFNGSTKVGYANLKTTGTITKTFDAKISEVRLGFDSGDTFDNFKFKVQIEKGTQATSYSPYKTPIKLTTNQERIYKDNNEWYLDKENGSSITTTQITDQELISQLESLQLLSGVNNVSVTSGDLAGDITIHYNYREAQNSKISYIDYLVPNNIIVANTPQGDQAFRITNVENTRSKIKIKAYHVFYDSKNYLIQDSYVVDKNCNDALDHLNNSTDNISPFTTISDITKINSYRCVRKSLYEAIQVLLERYGGHLVRDNWTIGIRASIGQDNGVMIRYGKNLKNIKATYNWDNVCTKLLPVGKDGLLLNALDPTASVYLESTTQYEIPYTKTVSFDQSNIVEDDYKDEETGEVDIQAYTQALLDDLTQQGQNYVQTNSVPVVNYTLSANVEKVSDIGDTIQVVDEKLGINILTNIISYEYDCILDKYTQIEFGNFTPTLSGLMNSITNQTQQIVDEGIATIEVTLGDELKEAQEKIWNALGNSYVIYEGDKILVVDSLPKETATNVIMINNGGIGFSNNGINGNFNSAWTIDNVLNMEQINVINLTADLIKGGTLKLGSNLNQNGQLEVYDEANSLIAQLNKDGLKMYGVDGSYILMNNTVGFSGYDRLGNQIYWVSKDEFHMKKSVVEEEITLCNKLRFIPITITDSNDNIVNDGIGLVSVAGGGN